MKSMLVKPSEQDSLHMLQAELARFTKTIERGKRELRKQIQFNASPQDAYEITLKKKTGIPEVLLKKACNQAVHGNHRNLGNTYTSLEDKSSLLRVAQGE